MNENTVSVEEIEEVKAMESVDNEHSEAAWAARDYATLIQGNAPAQSPRPTQNYEIRPCKSVRGHILRLPVTGWSFWFPTIHEAAAYAMRLATIHPAECQVYDASGGLTAL